MSKDIQKLGGKTDIAAVTATSAAKALSQTNSLYVIVENVGDNAVFINSGDSAVSVTFPTTSTGQNGAYISPVKGAQIVYKKNSPTDTHIAVICDTGLTSTLVIQAAEGN